MKYTLLTQQQHMIFILISKKKKETQGGICIANGINSAQPKTHF